MSNTELTLQPLTSKLLRTSGFRRMLLAGALALVLVPLGSVAVETATFTQTCAFTYPFFEGSYGGEGCNGGDLSATASTSRFDFGQYYLELMFDIVPGRSFDVTVNATEMDQETFQGKADLFPGYTCIALTLNGPCVEFEVLPSVDQVGNWTHYQIEIHWDKWTGQEAYDPALVTILHDIGTSGTRDYDEDMCLNSPPNDACTFFADPGIRSGDTDFKRFIASTRPATPVPEPSSLILLATGVSGVVFRRRRRT